MEFWGPNWGVTTAALLAMAVALLFLVGLMGAVVAVVDRWES